MTKAFLLISICLIVLSCASYPKQQNFETTEGLNPIINPYFANPEKDYIYKASIDVYDNNFGGVFIVKKTGALQHRVVFTTEMGNKIFDFSFDDNEFKVNSILEALNKKVLINILKRDFMVLLANNLPTTETYKLGSEIIKKAEVADKSHYYYYSGTSELQKVVRTSSGKQKVVFLFEEIISNSPEKIKIMHSNIKLNINLKRIN